MRQSPQQRDHKASTKDSPLVQATVTVRASAEDVMNAWSDGELLKQWWGPEGFHSSVAVIDFRIDGKYEMNMKNDDGSKELWSKGSIIELVENRKLVLQDGPGDESSRQYGPFAKTGDAYITLELRELGGDETEVTLSHAGLPADQHDNCVDGWNEALGKLKRFVERH